MWRRDRHRIEPYLKRLFGYAFCLSGDRERAGDLVQECVVKALAARRVPRDEAAYCAWLFTVMRNLFIDGQRGARELPSEPGDEPLLESWEVWRSEDGLLTALTVKLAMAKLSPPHREIIALIDIVGFSYSEASGFLDIAPGTVMSRLSRARQALLRVMLDSNVRTLPRRARGAAS